MIEFKGVTKVYDNGTVALDDLDLFIDKGEFVFVLGHSGAGKSTMIKLLLREEVPTTGAITVGDYNLRGIKARDIPYLRRKLGVVFQDFRLIPTMTAYENVAFAMRVTNIEPKDIRKRVPYILHLVGLTDKARRYPDEMSGGEQQRVALARALVHNPPVIIADEPTGNIDPELSYEIMDLLSEINKLGTTVVVVTHEQDMVRRFRRRTIVLKDGKLASDTGGPPRKKRPESEETGESKENEVSNIKSKDKRPKKSKKKNRIVEKERPAEIEEDAPRSGKIKFSADQVADAVDSGKAGGK